MNDRAPGRSAKLPGPRAVGPRPYPRIWGPPGQLFSIQGRSMPPASWMGWHVDDVRSRIARAQSGDPAGLVNIIVEVMHMVGKGRAIQLMGWTDADSDALGAFLMERLVLPPVDKRAQPPHVAAWVRRLDAILVGLTPKASLALRMSFIRETVATFDVDLSERLPLRAILAASGSDYYKASRKKSSKSET